MNYRRLGKTGLMVSEVGFGAEWLERLEIDECRKIFEACEECGINIFDCWMSEPNVRSRIGECIKGKRDKWFIQGHVGSTFENGQYCKTRDLNRAKPAFEDLLKRLGTDYIDLGMIHYCDSDEDFDEIMNGPFIEYIHELKEKGIIRHVGMSSHNPKVAKRAVLSGEIEMLLFSINPAFDLMAPTEDVDDLFANINSFTAESIDPDRAELYRLCEQQDIGITVMKAFAGGRMLDVSRSPFEVALTPVQCIHYALTRPAVGAVMCGYFSADQVYDCVRYESATDEEKDYSTVLANAPKNAFSGKCMYCNHCKPCTMDIDIAMVNKLYDLATMQNEVPASIKQHYLDMERKASDCIECYACESRCPFKVSIVERMQKAKDLFEKQ